MSEAPGLIRAAVLDLEGGDELTPFLTRAVAPFLAPGRSSALAAETGRLVNEYLDLATAGPPARVTIRVLDVELALSTDAVELGELIEAVYLGGGWEGLKSVTEAISRARSKLQGELEAAREARGEAESWMSADVSGTPDRALTVAAALPGLRGAEERATRALRLLDDVAAAFDACREVFVGRFETLLERFDAEARVDLAKALTGAEETIARERQRYGVRVEIGSVRTVYLGETPDSEALVNALRQLARHRTLFRELERDLRWAETAETVASAGALVQLWNDIARGLSPGATRGLGDPLYSAASDRRHHAEEALRNAQIDYARLRAALATEYPIVERIAELVNEGDDREWIATVVVDQTDLVLRSVRSIREGIAEAASMGKRAEAFLNFDTDPADRVARTALAASVHLWRMPALVVATSRRMGFEPGDLGSVMVARILTRITARRAERDELLERVGFALVAINFAVGPAGAVLLGIFSAMRAIHAIAEDREQYTLLAATFGPVQALTNEEPSSLRLYAALLEAGLDMVAAVAAVRALSRPAARVAAAHGLLERFPERGHAATVLQSEIATAERELHAVVTKAQKELPESKAAAVTGALEATSPKATEKPGPKAQPPWSPPASQSNGSPKTKGSPGKGVGAGGAKPKPAATEADGTTLATDVGALQAIRVDVIVAIEKADPGLAARLNALLTPSDWDQLVLRAARQERKETASSYQGVVNAIAGDVLEVIVPHMPELGRFLAEAAVRIARVPYRWGAIRVARVTEAAGDEGKRKFADFVVWCEGVDAENRGYVLLLGIIEAKAGDPSTLFTKVVKSAAGRTVGVGQFGRVRERLQNAIWLDGKPVSFEKLIFELPTVDLTPGAALTPFVGVMTRNPTWRQALTLVGSQEVTADVWRSPFSADEIQWVADMILRTVGKAPK